jgi:hypothetical protein
MLDQVARRAVEERPGRSRLCFGVSLLVDPAKGVEIVGNAIRSFAPREWVHGEGERGREDGNVIS